MTEDEWNLLTKELIAQGKVKSELELMMRLLHGEKISFKANIDPSEWRGLYGSCS